MEVCYHRQALRGHIEKVLGGSFMSEKRKDIVHDIPDYTLRITKQKGIRMRVSANGQLVVHANPFCSQEIIDKYVLTHYHEMYFQLKQPSVRLFGKSFQIRKVIGNTNHVSTCDNELIVQARDERSMEKVFEQFLKSNAQDVLNDISQMIFFRFQSFSLKMPKISIRKMKSSWGVCHPDKNEITLNFELIHYPIEFIEYVICHEFVHLIEPSHSTRFYTILSELMPDYKRRIDLIETSNEKQYLM